MKKLVILFLLLCGLESLLAQSSAFVLVDVSGNLLNSDYKITQPMRIEAVALAKAIITNTYNNSFDKNWTQAVNTDPRIVSIMAGKGRPLIDAGGYLMIMPFGAKDTYKKLQITPIINYPADFDKSWQFISSFSYDQQETFAELAKAKAANAALEASIKNYFLIVIVGLGDDTKSASYTGQEKKYIADYKSAASINSLAVFSFKDPNVDFKVEFSEINVAKMKPGAPGSQPIITPGSVTQKILEIITPTGKRNAPTEFTEKDNVNVQWRCLGCGENTSYKIAISKIEGGERVSPITVLKQFSHNVPALKAGVYGIKVTADNLGSQTVYVKVGSAGSWGWLLWLLAMAAIGGLGYYVWKNFIRDKDDDEDEQGRRSIFDPSRRQQPQPNTPHGYQGGGGSQSSSPDYD